MVAIIAVFDVIEGKRDALIRTMKEKKIEQRFAAQPGCVCYMFGVPINEENKLYLTDVWESEDALTAHTKCEVVPDWVAIKEEFISNTSLTRYDF